MSESKWTEDNAVLATIEAAAAGTGTATSDVVDLQEVRRVTFILLVASVLATGTVDMDIQEGTSTGSFNTATALKSITRLTGTADQNKQALVEVEASELSDGFRFLRAIVTTATANSIFSLVAIGAHPTYHPTSDFDLASVAEIVNT